MMYLFKAVVLFLFNFIFYLFPSLIEAQEKVYFTKRFVSESPVIDGIIDDTAWDEVDWGGNYIQQSPNLGMETMFDTRFKIIYDDNFIYAALRAFDNEPDRIVDRLTRRDDNVHESELLEIVFDSFGDNRTGYHFAVNAAGVKRDIFWSEYGSVMDESWDPIYDAKVSIDSLGWSAEFRIPFTQLRFEDNDEKDWGLVLFRNIYREQTWYTWKICPPDFNIWLTDPGKLKGISGIKPKRQFELMPYSIVKSDFFKRKVGSHDRRFKNNDIAAGFDGKIGITNGLTLDFSINPDFGQVESDPSVINLTSFETFLEEKRPLFIEGKDIFYYPIGALPDERLFYTRRIGQTPRYSPDLDDEETFSKPDYTSIIGAAKLTGKTANGWLVGIFDAVTSSENGSIETDGDSRNVIAEPITNYFVGSLKKPVNGGNTVLGGVITSLKRNTDKKYHKELVNTSLAGLFDLQQFWRDRKYFLKLKTGFSHLQGTKEAILEVQTSHPHDFQRDNFSTASVDSGRTSLTGYNGLFQIGKNIVGKDVWKYDLLINWISPGYDVNEMGYLNRTDFIHEELNLGYDLLTQVSIFNDLNLSLKQVNEFMFDGKRIASYIAFNSYFRFRNNWELSLLYWQTIGDFYRVWWLHGGPALRSPSYHNQRIEFKTSAQKNIQFTFEGISRIDANDWGENFTFTPGLILRPLKNLNLSIQTQFQSVKNKQQYIEHIDNGFNRYILGDLDQKTIGITLRTNFCITPEMSLQLYAQPFVSNQKYNNFKKLIDPVNSDFSKRFTYYDDSQYRYDAVDESYHFDEDLDGIIDYSIDDPDFNLIEFNSNLVYRWEYSPGSVLYITWSQNRYMKYTQGKYSFNDSFKNMWSDYPGNLFLIKLSYWFSV